MARISYLDLNSAPEKSKANLQALQQKLGTLPNIFKALANSPAALQSYVALTGAISESTLSPATREAIALAVAESNGCEYCLAAHSLIGSKAGLQPDDLLAARQFNAKDTKTAAVLKLSKQLLQNRGQVTEADLQSAKSAGITDGELADICAIIALNIFTNYFNNMSKMDVDFPKVPLMAKAA